MFPEMYVDPLEHPAAVHASRPIESSCTFMKVSTTIRLARLVGVTGSSAIGMAAGLFLSNK